MRLFKLWECSPSLHLLYNHICHIHHTRYIRAVFCPILHVLRYLCFHSWPQSLLVAPKAGCPVALIAPFGMVRTSLISDSALTIRAQWAAWTDRWHRALELVDEPTSSHTVQPQLRTSTAQYAAAVTSRGTIPHHTHTAHHTTHSAHVTCLRQPYIRLSSRSTPLLTPAS